MKPSCRRQKLLAYFGDKHNVDCNRTCDYCHSPDVVKARLKKLSTPKPVHLMR
jgi:superfamily II DNA helicase RecQ